jgi:hypothetical protein
MSEIDLKDDLKFQRAEWRVQRVGWILWAAILAAGFIGLLGPGPLSASRDADAGGNFSVNYDRFLHYHHPTQLRVNLGDSLPASTELELTLSQEYLDGLQIRRVEPEPVRSSIGKRGVVYTFSRTEAADAGVIVFHLEFHRIGLSRGQIGINGRDSMMLDQFIYP